MSKHYIKLGSGMTGKTSILEAMVTDRIWVSPPTSQDHRGLTHLPCEGKLCGLPLRRLLLPFCIIKTEILNLALRSIKCQAMVYLYPRR